MQTENYKEELSERMLSVKQIAYGLNVHPSTVRRWEKNGLLKAYRIGPRGNIRFARDDIVDFVCERRQEVLMKQGKMAA